MFLNAQNKRIKYILLFVILIFIIIIARVFYIQVIEYDKLNDLANNLWSRELPVEADRGKILDRNGKVIASNLTTASLVVVPNQIKNKKDAAKKISKILDADYEEILRHFSKKTSIERVHPEGRRLSYEVADKIDALNIDGVYLVKESKRNYENDEVLSHVLGYVGIDNQGLSGVELLYDEYLTGENGSIKYFSDGKGHKLKLNEVYEAPQSGMNISLTIDLDLQLALERELNNAVTKYNPEQALGIVMNPKTGEILAMSNRPTFNPNYYQNYTTEEINRNLSIWSNYEPGSTFKIVTLAASIEEETVNIFEDRYFDSGSISVSGRRLHCWKHEGHGNQTFLQVVENSCNPGFVVLGQKLGKNKLFKYINKFGFGKKTGIDLNGESTGILFDLKNVGLLELATSAFGQGVSVTPIQQVTAVSGIINNGNMYKPMIVKSINEPETNNVIKEFSPTLRAKNIISKKTSKLTRYALESVVANGSGRHAYIENYRVGGKTGTAQKVDNGRYLDNNYIVSFMGFLPADDPELVVYIAIDNPKGVVQYGGTIAGPVAKKVMQEAINLYDIKEDKEGLPRKYEFYDEKYLTVPDVIGMSKKEAIKELEGFVVEYSGYGKKVIDMSIEPGTRVKENSTIKLMLN